MNKIALFTTVNKNYVSYAERCFQLFEDSNPGVFDFYLITSDKEVKSTTNIIILDPKDYIDGLPEWGWPPECFLYFTVPNLLHKKGYKYSMYIDADCVSLKKLDFSWLNDNFILAGSPRMRNDLSEEIDAWYFLNQIGKSPENINFLESSFELQNKDNIIDINSGVIIFNNKRWVDEKLYDKAYSLFNTCKENNYPMTDDDSLLTLLLLDTHKEFYKHLSLDWNWYYERPEVKSMGGDNVNILHMAWLKPWSKGKDNKNINLKKGLSVWNKRKKKMRLHTVGCARNPSTKDLTMDPYAMISYYLTTYLHRGGHEVHYYGYKESTVECTKKWECGDYEFQSKYYITEGFEKTHWQESAEGNNIFFNKAKDHLLENYHEGDIIICNWSPCVDILRKAFPYAKIVDGNINHRYPSTATNYHVHSSLANQHFLYGKDAERLNVYDREGYWHDTVIYPMANDLSNFRYNENKSDYFLFMGRLGQNKGITIFRDIAKHFPNKKFIVAGQGSLVDITLLPNMEFVGCLDGEQRKEYLANAKAVISPSYYCEPFGLTPVEAGLSGTPIICTDWGGYTENVLDGVTGFRCTFFNDFVNAVNNIESINPKECRRFAERFSAETLIKDWERYLHKINRNEWYTLD